jgi:hypothetical protein
MLVCRRFFLQGKINDGYYVKGYKIMGTAYFWNLSENFGFMFNKKNHGTCNVVRDQNVTSIVSIRLVVNQAV